ncbi:DUF4279 domain-containing protein [Methylobacterium segetis]|uniref:DUF4279 domain-containing protein n=1 Tax=Methylobacterium segetis TaxID=2488750 RepID=UPI0014045A75|nr:DUF4279 domain-containing protein [Methylobacterium segetis]
MTSTDSRPLPATYASVVFQGVDLDPELISAIMETSPTLSYKRGDTYRIKHEIRERQFGLWVYSTRNVVHSSSLKKHLAALERLVIGEFSQWPNKTLAKIQALVNESDIKFRVDVFWYGAADSELPEISRSFHYVVTEAGGTVETDFHRDGETTQAA